MKFVKRIEDTNLWKKQFEESGKGRGNTEGNYYVVNHSGRGESTQIIPPVAQDLIAAQTKIKKDSKRKKVSKTRKVKRKSSQKKKKVKCGRVSKRKYKKTKSGR